MNSLTLQPISKLSGDIVLPGSKSLSNRALLLAALAAGDTTLSNLLQSEDTDYMIKALTQLGVQLDFSDDMQTCKVKGNDGLFASPGNPAFFLGCAGTAIRPLTAVLSLIPGRFEIDGDKYMRERPIAHLADALITLGAEISYQAKDGCPPLILTGGIISGGATTIPGNISSQFLTALLMALPLAPNDSIIHIEGDQVSKPYLDITLGILEQFGVTANHENYECFNIPGGQSYQSPGNYLIEGDASSASYFLGGGALPGGHVKVHGLGRDSVQGDYQFVDTIEQMGATVNRQDTYTEVRGNHLRGVDVDLNHIPDAAMTIAALALFAEGKTTIRNIYNWRVKETDRMHAMQDGLTRLGAQVETSSDSITITPPTAIKAAEIETYGDHRVAMSFSLAALGDTAVTIKDPECTRKTFPDYFDVLETLSVR